MRKFKYFIMGISFFIMLLFLYFTSNIDQVLNANTDNNIDNNTVQFDLYDKVYTTMVQGDSSDMVSTVIDTNGDKISMLDDKGSLTNGNFRTTYDGAIDQATHRNTTGALQNEAKGRFAKRVNYFSIPTTQDLQMVIEGDGLSSNVPNNTSISAGYPWWLGDEPIDNRVKYLTPTNKFNGANTYYTKISISDYTGYSAKCSYDSRIERGVMLRQADKIESVSVPVYQMLNIQTSSGSIDWVTSGTTGKPGNFLKGYSQLGCTGTVKNSSLGLNSEALNLAWNTEVLDDGRPYFFTGTSIGGWGGLNLFASSLKLTDFIDIRDSLVANPGTKVKKELLIKKGQCMAIDNTLLGKTSKSVMNTSNVSDIKLTVYFSKIVKSESTDFTCASKINMAGVASARFLRSFPTSEVLFKNIEKRGLADTTGHLDLEFPVSDERAGKDSPAYLTFRDPDSTPQLQETENVNTSTDTIRVQFPSDYMVNIPLQISVEEKYNNRYITASAMINGEKKYGRLGFDKSLNIAKVDLRDFSNDPSNLDKIELSLYSEVIGDVNDYRDYFSKVNFMSDPLDVTILLDPPKATQSISFDPDLPTTATYGEPFTITSRLSSDDIDTQSAYDLLFKIDSGNARITEQSYDATTGIASAKVLPIGGTGDVTVSISKKGDDNADDAVTQTYTFGLLKKDITVQPKLPDKVYAINDTMPSFTSISSDLINSDQIPSVIVPTLENIDASGPALPYDGNKIVNLGMWKLVYPTDILDSIPTSEQSFLDNYNVTLKDYTQDTSFVFETTIGTIPDDWIVITPVQPNEHGWYHDTVTISPSPVAIANGYDEIEIVNNEGVAIECDTTITYDSSIVITPKIRLKKGTVTSKTKTLSEIKVDKELPSASVEVVKENEWTNRKKDVHITITNETLSKIASVIVKRNGVDEPYTITQSNNVYSFVADQDGDYSITITNYAGNAIQIEKAISKIDTGIVDISAELMDFPNPSIKLSQDINVSVNAGASGIQAINAYYKKNASDSFTLLRALDDPEATMTFTAEMNGIYQFELVTNAGVKKTSAELTVEGLNPPLPCTKFTATYVEDGATKTYTSGTWTKHEITLDVSNTNSEIEEAGLTPVWEVSQDGTTWEAWNGPKTFTASETIQIRAKVEISGQIYYETAVKKFIVKLDQTLPDQPSVLSGSQYVDSAWFKESVKVETTYTKKTNGIKETLYVCDGTKAECTSDSAVWSVVTNQQIDVSENGKHQLYFKVVDEAGNESPLSDVAYVNINTETPKITIKLNNDPIKTILNQITLGYFFKDTVKVEAEVDFAPTGMTNGDGFGGKTYIVVDDMDGTMPEVNGDWGEERSSTTIDPDAKVKIYVKAESDAGKVARESTIYDVYVDYTKPEITVSNMSDWSKQNELSFTVRDVLSGLDHSALSYSIGATSSPYTVKNNTATIKGLPDGTYTIDLYAKDVSGNEITEQVSVMIDASAPVFGAINASTNWVKERDIIVSVSDQYSGISSIAIRNSNGVIVTHTDNGDDTITFTVNSNDTYTISAKDVAGNMSTKTYVEANVDTTAPAISDITVENEAVLAKSKKVSFKVEDTQSGVKAVSVTYREEGQEKTAAVSGPDVNGIYTFTARVNGSYTIKAEDEVGKISSESVYIDQIDPSSIKLNVLTNINTWVKDEMKIEFNLELGASTLEAGYPIVRKGNTEITPVLNEGVYSFTASENDSYVIEVKSTDGELIEETLQIQRIDGLSPIIRDISNNTTSSEYRGPISVSFHVYDYNDADENTIGSGLKTNYPVVYYMKDGNKHPCNVTQDETDTSKYSFTASDNVTYIVEAIDVVEHDLVKSEIPVDHIIDDSKISDLQVMAENKGLSIHSGDWVNGDITFTISGGLDTSILQKYQVAITDGTAPIEADWNNLNDSLNNKHKVTGEETGKSYWFRTLPIMSQTISEPFVVNLDNTAPTDVKILKTKKNINPISRFINTISFGNWLNESQDITFTAKDNATATDDLIFYYAEEQGGVTGAWKEVQGTLSYDDIDLILHVKAVDLAGNETEIFEPLEIDTEAPVIDGVKDQKEYKQYYLPRFVTIGDAISGLKQATYTRDGAQAGTFTEDVVEEIRGEGTYVITATDYAENEITLTFKIVKLPDINTEIDGSDESKEIIDQVKEEYEQIKEHIDQTEDSEYQNWVDQATSSWNDQRLLELEDKKTTSKVEGKDDTNFDPKTELVVEEVEASKVPTLPKQAIAIYKVYLEKNNKPIQLDGTVKVYLPYKEKEQPIVYQIDEQGSVKEISVTVEGSYVTFTTSALHTYAISNTAQGDGENQKPNPDDGKVCSVGPDGKPNTSDDVCGKPNEGGDQPIVNPDGSVTVPDGGTIVFPDGSEVELPDGGTIKPDGSVETPDKDYNPDGSIKDPDNNNGGNGGDTPNPNPDNKPNPAPNPDDGNGGNGGDTPSPNPDDKPNPTPNPDDGNGGNGGDTPSPNPDDKPNPTPNPDDGNGGNGGDTPSPNPDDKPNPTPNPDDGNGGNGGDTPNPDNKPNPAPNPDGGNNPDHKPNPDDDIVCTIGPDGKPNTSDDVCGKPNEDGDQPIVNPDGSITIPDGGTIVFPDGSEVVVPDGGTIKPDGSVETPDKDYKPDGSIKDPDDKPNPDDKPDYDVSPDIDSDGDGKTDINVDFDCDGKADINIDLNDDKIPDVNIDTTGDGKPNYNIDLNGDGKPDVNIGPVKWETDVCKTTACGKTYCTSSYYKPKLNVDTDGDGYPDVNLDFNGDRIPELNIDINFDYIPDLDIDTTGDGKPNINIDVDGNGIADLNLLKMTSWTPNLNGEKDGMKFDTMSGLQPVYNVDTSGDGKADSNIVDNKDNSYILSNKEVGGATTNVTQDQNETTNKVVGTKTGEATSWSNWWIMFGISTVSLITSVYTNRRRKRKLK